MADTTPPTIAIRSNKTALKAGDTALITFTLSEQATDFLLSDIAVTGGTLSNFAGSGTAYSATFTPNSNSTSQGSVSVGNFKFSDGAGNANEDGSEANNFVFFNIDTIAPTIRLIASKTYLGLNEKPTITFTLSEPSSDFDITDISVAGGTLSSFNGSGNTYSVVFNPNSTGLGYVSVSSSRFSDASQNFNYDFNELVFSFFDSQKANVVWTRHLGSNSEDYGSSITTDKDGAIYVTGTTYGSLDGQVNLGGTDAFVSKFNSNGVKLWTRLVGNVESVASAAITTDSFGAIYIAGSTYEGGNGGKVGLDGQTNSGNWDAFVTKFNPDGTKAWTRLLGSYGADEAHAIASGIDGAVYVAGFAGSSIDGATYLGYGDAFVAKFNSDGEKVWTRLFGSKSSENAYAVAVSKEGAVFLAGKTDGEIDGQSYSGGGDAFLTKYNSDGSTAWTRLLGTNTFESASSITLGIDGSIFIAGDTEGSLDSQKGSGLRDAFVTKFNSDGSKAWTRIVGSSGNEHAYALTTSLDGSIYLTGDTNGILDGQMNSGFLDAFVAKFTPDGTKVWTSLIGTKSFDFARSIISSAEGDIYIAGSSMGDLDGQISSGGYDAFVLKLVLPDLSSPKITVTSNKISLTIGETANLYFTLTKPSTNFVLSDITVVGGTLSNFLGTEANYSATFTPSLDNLGSASINVGSGKFSDYFGVFNEDGLDANNRVSFKIEIPPDTTPPTIAVSSSVTSLSALQSSQLAFTLSEASTNFSASDVTVTGGTLSNFIGSSTSYTATFTLDSNSALNGKITIGNGVFTDAAGNMNADGSDANNTVSFTRIPTITNEIHTLSVIVDKNVLGADAVLLKDLKESMTFTNGAITKHIVEYSGLTFDYSQIDSLITTVTRDGEFTAEFTKEVNDYVKADLNITYPAALVLIGVANINEVILRVAGADGNFVG